MPTQSTTYNSRVTDEALEKRFRDTFRAQGGAELVDDLYAQGVIVPVVDFTAAATGETLGTDLQTAWDFSTGSSQLTTATYTNIVTNAGFWLVDLTHTGYDFTGTSGTAAVAIFDGSTRKPVWARSILNTGGPGISTTIEQRFVVYLRSGDSLQARCQVAAADVLDIWYRQIATVSGDLINPTGFVSS